jgi:two-component system NtrC family sensor kinase
MDKAHVLVVSDNGEYADRLVNRLLPDAGYEVTLAQEDASPPAVDVVLVDVDRVMVSPLVGLKAQRRLGCKAPALLVAPRLNEAIAAQIFELNIRDFLTKPAKDSDLLSKIRHVLQLTDLERGHQQMGGQLRQQDETLKRRLNELDTLSRIGRVLTTVDEVNTVLARIVEAAVYLTRADEGALFMADEQGRLSLRAEKNLGQREASTLSTLSDDSTAAVVFQTGKPVLRGSGNDQESLKVKTGYLVQALINVPIVIGARIVGVLAVYNHSPKPFEENDLKTLSALGDYAAIALDKAQSVTELQQRVHRAAEVSRKISAHTGTMTSPIEAVEVQVDMLLSEVMGPTTESQADALQRIRLSVVRLKEIDKFVRQLTEEYRQAQEEAVGS